MSKEIQVDGVAADEKAATYVYTLRAGSGYRANETGRISANRHGIVCMALAGKLDDYEQVREQRAALLEALRPVADRGEISAKVIAEARAAIALAQGDAA